MGEGAAGGDPATPAAYLLRDVAGGPGALLELLKRGLVRMTELHADCELLTIDGEFRDVYRRRGRQVIPMVMPSRKAGRSRRAT